MDQTPEILKKGDIIYEIHRGTRLGEGVFGIVYKGTRKTDDNNEEIVAVKEILKSSLFTKDITQEG